LKPIFDFPAVGEIRDRGRIAFPQHPDGDGDGIKSPAFLAFATRQGRLVANGYLR
jgi:hypothetical protein